MYFELKIHSYIMALNIADWAMANTYFFEPQFVLDFVPEPNYPNMLTSLYKSSANPSYQSKFMLIGPEYEKTDIKRFSLMPVQFCLCNRILFYLCKISILFFTGGGKLSFNPS
jgi:hypothetical protein